MTRAPLAVAALALVGCSSLPEARPPAPLTPEAAPVDSTTLTVGVTLPRFDLAAEDAPKGYRAEEVLAPDEVRREVAAWLSAQGRFARVEVLPAEGAMTAAWDRALDLVVEPALEDLRVSFDGHNGWWIPNLVNWFYWMIPAWFVATEDYSLSFRGRLRVRSVASGLPLHEAAPEVRVAGTLNEFDRGWQFFGSIYPNNDADNWRQIGRALGPAALSDFGAAAAAELGAPLRRRLADPAARAQMRKTLALAVGVSRYRDAERLPPLAHAADDARAFAAALAEACGLEPRHVDVRLASDATLAGVEEGLGRLRARAAAGDRVVVYFAGYGTRGRDGAPTLLLQDADGAGGGALPLARLGAALEGVAGDVLVVLDAGFDGEGRSVLGGPAPDDAAASDLAPLAARGAVLAATQPGAPALEPEHLASGLLTHHLVRALASRAADADGDGRAAPFELLQAVEEAVVADAAYFGASQRPAGVGLDAGAGLVLVARARPAGAQSDD